MSVTWKKDGKLIWASYKYNVKTTKDSCVLEVLNSDRKEAVGKYTCELSNAAGTDICHANVKLGNTPEHLSSLQPCSSQGISCHLFSSNTTLLIDFLEPVSFVRKLRNTFYKVGKPLTLECTFTGSQRIYVTWMKDGKLIWASYKYNVKTTKSCSSLEVLNSDRREAAGKYSCEISNSEGTAICHAMVTIGKASDDQSVLHLEMTHLSYL